MTDSYIPNNLYVFLMTSGAVGGHLLIFEFSVRFNDLRIISENLFLPKISRKETYSSASFCENLVGASLPC